VLLTTQYLEEADQLADRIAVLDGGRIVAEGTPSDLKSRLGETTVELRDSTGSLRGEATTDGSAHGIRTVLDRWDTAGLDGEVTLRRPTLDDVFVHLTARDDKELV
jgi:ABC-2 type transport system ATP-binding protein